LVHWTFSPLSCKCPLSRILKLVPQSEVYGSRVVQEGRKRGCCDY
jgi:hypothetical protein